MNSWYISKYIVYVQDLEFTNSVLKPWILECTNSYSALLRSRVSEFTFNLIQEFTFTRLESESEYIDK